MQGFDTRVTPDYSPFVVHFTRDRSLTVNWQVDNDHPLYEHKQASALERLANILRESTVYASPIPFVEEHPNAVCLSECVWPAIADLSEQYSPYGLAFNKRVLFNRGGGPALYVRGDMLREVGTEIPVEIRPLISPFDPDAVLKEGRPLDWIHEREWRLPCDLRFVDAEVEYVIVDSVADVHELISTFGTDRIPRNKFIVMEVYRNIQNAWGSS